MNVRIEESFELLSQQEWDDFLAVNYFDNMIIDGSKFGIIDDFIGSIGKPKLPEIIQQHNNKIGDCKITYCFCRHYYDRGIPDDPWYSSPGENGESIQYFPYFKKEHWMRKYWFTYFSDTYYLKMSAVWDSIVELLNYYYGSDYRLKSNVLKWLKDNQKNLYDELNALRKDKIFQDANKYRTAVAHGISENEIHNTILEEKNVTATFPKIDEKGNVVFKEVKGKRISATAGEYTNVKTIMDNMQDYAVLSGNEIQKIISIILAK